MRPLRIGVNALYLIPGGVGGTEIYLRSLLAALAEIDPLNQYFIFSNQETDDLAPERPNFTAVRQPVPGSIRPARILWEQTVLPLHAARLRLDVLFNPGFTAPLLWGGRSVTVFHDLQHKLRPEYFRWFDLPFWRLLLWSAAHRSTQLIAVSKATRDDLLKLYRLPPAKVSVVPHGVDPAFFEISRRRREEPYLLTVSTLHPHKNLDLLLKAFAEFRCHKPEYRLVIAGLRGFHTRALEQLRDSLGLDGVVRLTGWIPRNELYELFAHAAAFLYPSRFEGFGMPVLEALAAGLPTACSRIEPLTSLTAGAALQFDPDDLGELTEAMKRLASDKQLCARLARAGPQRAAQFSWHSAAVKTLALLRGQDSR